MTRIEVEGFVSKAIEKQLGKIGTSKLTYKIEKVSPYDGQADLVL